MTQPPSDKSFAAAVLPYMGNDNRDCTSPFSPYATCIAQSEQPPVFPDALARALRERDEAIRERDEARQQLCDILDTPSQPAVTFRIDGSQAEIAFERKLGNGTHKLYPANLP